MADQNYIQDIKSASASLASSAASGQTQVVNFWTIPASRRGQTAYARLKASNTSGKMEIYHWEGGTTGTSHTVWRSADGFDPMPSNERPIDFLTRYMNGLVLEATDVLQLGVTITVAPTATLGVSASVWVVERNQ